MACYNGLLNYIFRLTDNPFLVVKGQGLNAIKILTNQDMDEKACFTQEICKITMAKAVCDSRIS